MSDLVPAGAQTLVNAATAGDQTPSALAVLTGGQAVAAFLDAGSGATVAKLRLIGADGAPAGGEITVAPASDVQVAALGGGGFAVSWIETGASQVFVRVETFDAAGQSVGPVQTLATYDRALDLANGVNSYASAQGLHMTALTDGGYALAWSVSTHDSMSFVTTSPVLVVADSGGVVEANARLSGSHGKGAADYDMHATPVQLTNGQVMVTWWQQADSATGGGNPFAGQQFQLFDAQGVSLAPAKLLDPQMPADGGPTVNGAQGISVTALTDGHLVFVWNQGGSVEASIYPEATLGQGNLTGRTPPMVVGETTGAGEPQVIQTDGAGFAVVWTGSGSGSDLLAQLYSNSGAPAGSTFHLGDIAAANQDMPQVAAYGDGLMAIWRDDSHATARGGSDASGAAVMLQTYAPAGGEAPNVLVGTAGDDRLAGGAGEDWLNGLGGRDTLSGGGGPDKFVLSPGGVDEVLDFRSGSDHLLLFDSQGNIADASHGALIFQASSHSLWFDPDGDAGDQPAQELAVIDGVDAIGKADLAAGLEPRAIMVFAADGAMKQTVIDWGQASWSTTVTDFTSTGLINSYSVNEDDGSHWTTWFDVGGQQAWSTRTASYDAAGGLTEYAVAYDDGRHEIFTFDPSNGQPWQRMVDDYNAAGQLVSRAIVSDDGSYKIATFDVENAHPWSMLVELYSAAGVHVGVWTYNDDGAFVG